MKTKDEEVLNEIVVSEPYVITGFKDKINNLPETEEELFTTKPADPWNEYPKTHQSLELLALGGAVIF